MDRFSGRVALITGAGSGIGRAVAERLVAEGASVLAVDINGEALQTLEGVAPHVADLTSPLACAEAVAACVGAFGRLDVIGNIAGVARADHVTDVSEEQYRRMMAINVDACFFLSQAAIPHLLRSDAPGGGTIVNLASNAGLMGQAYTVVYCMSKGAVIQLTRALAMEYVKTPLRVNAIAPAGVNTPLAHNFQIPADVDFTLMQPYMGHRPPAEPADVAAMFAHLASADSAAVNGAIIPMDSGITAG